MVVRAREPDSEGDLATSTLAEIYAQQGLYERALAIYQRIAIRAPRDEAIAERIAMLTHRIERSQAGAEIPVGPAVAPHESPAAAPHETPEPAPHETPEPAPHGTNQDDEFQAWLSRR
ncbi:MAG TPA: hypothetical protein VM737_04315 [Gemmatimonadota bacterium]|nr:hypothetical protein [Gemmatimonadota bacterium]